MRSTVIVLVVFLGAQMHAAAFADTQPLSLGEPIRRLEYQFSVDYQRLGEMHEGAIGTDRSGVSSLASGTGRQGTIDVDVLALADDGGIVARVSEWLREEPRPGQAYTCAVYPEGRVDCPGHVGVTDVEELVLSYLGRGFFDSRLIDSGEHWRRAFADKYLSVVSDFVIVGPSNANPLSIRQHTEITSLLGNGANWDETSQLYYDCAMEIPRTVHDVAVASARGSAAVEAIVDLKLASDSFNNGKQVATNCS